MTVGLTVQNDDVAATGHGITGKATGGVGIYGESTNGEGVFGDSTNERGVRGRSVNGDGVEGGSANRYGVHGISDKSYGVYGTSSGSSAIVGESTAAYGVYGHSTVGAGVVAGTDAGGHPAMAASGPGASAYFAWGNLGAQFVGDVWINGSLYVFGPNKSAVVALPDGSHRALYCMESPESWFEDFGHARLVQGKAKVRLDRTFAAAVRTDDYYVFLSPEGDSAGLYIHRYGRAGFEVREHHRGTSTMRFGYKIVARRKGVSAPRFKKVTPRKPVALTRPKVTTMPKPLALPKRLGLPERLARSGRAGVSRRASGRRKRPG